MLGWFWGAWARSSRSGRTRHLIYEGCLIECCPWRLWHVCSSRDGYSFQQVEALPQADMSAFTQYGNWWSMCKNHMHAITWSVGWYLNRRWTICDACKSGDVASYLCGRDDSRRSWCMCTKGGREAPGEPAAGQRQWQYWTERKEAQTQTRQTMQSSLLLMSGCQHNAPRMVLTQTEKKKVLVRNRFEPGTNLSKTLGILCSCLLGEMSVSECRKGRSQKKWKSGKGTDRHVGFAGGHPTHYWWRPRQLCFRERTRTGIFSLVWTIHADNQTS